MDDVGPDNYSSADELEGAGAKQNMQAPEPPGAGAGAKEKANTSKAAAETAHGGRRTVCGRKVGTGKGLGGNGKGGKGSKGQRQCQGCMKWMSVEEFPLGSVYCHPDKKAIQNMRNMAIREDMMDWYEEQMASLDKRKVLLQKFHEKTQKLLADRDSKKTKLPKLLQLQEAVKTSTDTTKSALGRMMWRGEYMAFRAKRKNGGWSEIQASAHFDILIDKRKSPTALVDQLHEDPMNPDVEKTRVWVKTADQIAYNDKEERSKSYLLNEREIKKATQADIDRAYAKVHENFESVGGMSAPSSGHDIAAQMVSAIGVCEMWEGRCSACLFMKYNKTTFSPCLILNT